MRLSSRTLPQLPAGVGRFSYPRDEQAIGIVHFGIGAFHRAHMAWYTDLAMDAGDHDWAICGVSMRSRDVTDQLDPQDGLYTVTERSGTDAQSRVIGAVREVLFAQDDRARIVARIAAPECRMVSFTVTEKGYARSGDGGLDLQQAERSFYPILADALAERKAQELGGITLLSCDNLAENGRQLRKLMQRWIEARAPELSEWFANECTVPSTMVDRIVPRSTPDDLAQLQDRLGMEDHAAVFTEKFSQWVIEDDFAAGHPRWDEVGAQLVGDVVPYENAKLRMLNGAHSMLAYCGLQAGHEFVHEAVADERIGQLARDLMLKEAAPSLAPAPDQDLASYARDLVERFSDPALQHRLAQIAMDGTQKIPQRWLDTVNQALRDGRETPSLQAAFNAWLWHIEDGRFVDDPNREALLEAMQHGGREAVLDLCFGGGKAPALWPEFASLRTAFER